MFSNGQSTKNPFRHFFCAPISFLANSREEDVFGIQKRQKTTGLGSRLDRSSTQALLSRLDRGSMSCQASPPTVKWIILGKQLKTEKKCPRSVQQNLSPCFAVTILEILQAELHHAACASPLHWPGGCIHHFWSVGVSVAIPKCCHSKRSKLRDSIPLINTSWLNHFYPSDARPLGIWSSQHPFRDVPIWLLKDLGSTPAQPQHVLPLQLH